MAEKDVVMLGINRWPRRLGGWGGFCLLLGLWGAAEDAQSLWAETRPHTESEKKAHEADIRLAGEAIAGLWAETKRLTEDKQYDEALAMAQQAVTLLEQAKGPKAAEVGVARERLAAVYAAHERYDQAAVVYRQALAIYEGCGCVIYQAYGLSALGRLYERQGAYTQAQPLLEQAVALFTKYGQDRVSTALLALFSLARVYKHKERLEQAESLYKKILEIQEQQDGPQSLRAASTLNALGALYADQGAYAQAALRLRQALALREQGFGPRHPVVGETASNLGGVYLAQGQVPQASYHLLRALGIMDAAHGPQHPSVAAILLKLSSLYARHGGRAMALRQAERAMDIYEHHLARVLAYGAEAQKRAYWALYAPSTAYVVSLQMSGSAPAEPEALRLAATTVLRHKGRVLDAMADVLRTVRRHPDPAVQAQGTQLAALRAAQAGLFLRALDAQDYTAVRDRLAWLDTQAETLEAQLSAQSVAFRAATAPITLDAVQRALPSDAALIEVLRYEPPHLPNPQKRAPRYAGYVLRSQGVPQGVDLGEVAVIDQQVHALLQALGCPPGEQRSPKQKMAQPAPCPGLPVLQDAARVLETQIMQPLLPLLGEARLLMVAPDGALNLLPFGVLMDAQQRYLAEHFTFTYLTSGRDLLRHQHPVASQEAPVIMASPAFSPVDEKTPVVSCMSPLDPPYAVAAQKLEGFSPLPGTVGEGCAVHRMLGGTLWLGAQATEARLKQLHGPRILHLATHGFSRFAATRCADDVLPPALVDAMPTQRAFKHAWPGTTAQDRLAQEYPMLQSGIALAGANVCESEERNDGLLTAAEAAGLDLVGTQLVVLSACETGVGAMSESEGTQLAEGVYGLRRALVLAGAESQVISLWKVDDRATQHLMVMYYQRLLAGEGRAEALHQAQRTLRDSPTWSHPYFWAGFIPVGEWRPLERERARQP